MPFSMSFSTWYDHQEVLSKAHQEVVKEQLTLNKAEARKQAIEEHITDADGQPVISIPVSFEVHGQNEVTLLIIVFNLLFWMQLARYLAWKLFPKPVACMHRTKQV